MTEEAKFEIENSRGLVEKLKQYDKDTIIKAFVVFANWAEECDFGFDNMPDMYEKYKDKIEYLDYIEGLVMIPVWEVLKGETE